MHITHLIVDDFFDHPDEVRRQILSFPYPPRPDKAYYPGRNAGRPLNLPGIDALVSDIVHEPLMPAPETSHSVPRLAMEGDVARCSVHIDNCHWSAIIYLTLDMHCQGGTFFFRHKRTGWDMAPVWPGMPQSAGYTNSKEAVTSIFEQDGNDRSKWEEIMMIPMKYNRLVLFRGYLWHDAGPSFGTTPENSRLIVPLFFENTNPQ